MTADTTELKRKSKMKKSSNWGGQRAGAGRKAYNPDGGLVSINWTISRKAKESLIAQAKAKGLTIAEFLDEVFA